MQKDPDDLAEAESSLKQAKDLLRYFDPATAGMWPRAVALLARQSLESALATFWSTKAPQVARCSSRAQLLSLRAYVDKEIAQQGHQAWVALSHACHHHPYELSPAASELESWILDVEAVKAELGRAMRDE